MPDFITSRTFRSLPSSFSGYLPATSLILLATLIPVQKNIRLFFRKQVKEETFIVSIKNFILFLLAHTALIALGSLLPGWGPT